MHLANRYHSEAEPMQIEFRKGLLSGRQGVWEPLARGDGFEGSRYLADGYWLCRT